MYVFALQRLAEIAHSLLKVAPYDPETMSCRGLVKYMNQILTYPDWSQEALKPTLIIIMRRLEKVFTKILKKSFIRVCNFPFSFELVHGVSNRVIVYFADVIPGRQKTK